MTVSDQAPVLTEDRDGVLVVTLNRPKALNALSHAMLAAFVDVIGRVNDDEAIRAVVITGAGNRAFSAGQDLNEAQAFDQHNIGDHFRRLGRLYQSVRALEKPCVIALNGVTAGFGLQVSLHADYRIAHDGVRMSQPEVAAGIPSVMGLWIIKEVVGLARAVEMSLTCRLVPAPECLEWGLIDEIVPRDELLERAIEIAREIGAKPEFALRASKQNALRLTQAAYDETIEAAVRIQEEAFSTGEPQQVAAAFLARKAKS